MAGNLPPLWRFSAEDYVGLGKIFKGFLDNLNLFTQAVYDLVNGGIGYANLQQSVYSVTVLAGSTTPLSFVNPLVIPPSAVVLGQVVLIANTPTAITNAVCVGNWTFDGKTISILDIPGLTSGQTYKISVVIS